MQLRPGRRDDEEHAPQAASERLREDRTLLAERVLRRDHHTNPLLILDRGRQARRGGEIVRDAEVVELQELYGAIERTDLHGVQRQGGDT